MALETNNTLKVPSYIIGEGPVEKVVDLGVFPFKKIDDSKQKGIVIDAVTLKVMYQKLGILHEEGVDKAFIAGYTMLLNAMNTVYDETFK